MMHSKIFAHNRAHNTMVVHNMVHSKVDAQNRTHSTMDVRNMIHSKMDAHNRPHFTMDVHDRIYYTMIYFCKIILMALLNVIDMGLKPYLGSNNNFAMFFNLIYHFYLSYRKNTAIYVDLTPPHLNLIVCYTCILHLRIALPCRNWWCNECSKITKVRFPYIKKKVCKSNLIIF